MNNSTVRKALIAVVSCLIILLIFGGCEDSERIYYDDINITLQDSSERIIIKEWSFLLGSGIEVYYQKNDTDPVLLGKRLGGDNGFCPFKEGMYEFSQDGNSVTLKWAFRGSQKNKTDWCSETFDYLNNLGAVG